MANYIGEQGIKVLAELRPFLNSFPPEKQALTQLVKQVPGSRSFFGFLKYQLLEKEADYAAQRKRLADSVTNHIENMRKKQRGENYVFVAKDADCLAYILNDLDSERNASGAFSRLGKYVPDFIKRLMQPGGIKRYVAILIIAAFIVFSILSIPLLHVGIVTSLLVSAAVMYGLKKLADVGQNSDDSHIEVCAVIQNNPQVSERNTLSDSTQDMREAFDSSVKFSPKGGEVPDAVIEGEAHPTNISEQTEDNVGATDDPSATRPNSP